MFDNDILRYVQDDNTLTQSGLKEKLKEERDVNFTQSCISRVLKRNNITRKRIKTKPLIVVSPEMINARKTYARELRCFEDSQILFLDESGFNLHTSTKYGYSPIDTDAVKLVPANRGKNVSLLMIISEKSIVKTLIKTGSINRDIFLKFLDELVVEKLIKQNQIIILDNARCHHGKVVENWSKDNEIIIKYLPPYSPALNPIEQVFSVLKAEYDRIRPRARTQNSLIENINLAVQKTKIQQLQPFYRNMRKFVDKAFQGIPF